MGKGGDPMVGTPVYGYLFRITCTRAEKSWVAYAPGVGGVYAEGDTQEDAVENAYRSACAVLEARAEQGHWLTEDSPELRVVRRPLSARVMEEMSAAPDEYLVSVPC
jgi:predicted RNase H-like HicB family nuclease